MCLVESRMIANTYEKKNNNGKNLENTLFLFYRLQCNVVARSNQITKEEAQIPMRNMVVYQPDGTINTIYWVLGDEKFLSLERSDGGGLTTDELMNFASKIGEGIKNYK